MKSNQSVAWDLPGRIHNQQESRSGMRERLLGIGGKIPGTRMQRDQSLSSERSSFDCRAQSRMDKRIRDRVEVKLPLCWDLTPNLIGSVRLTQCLLLPTWKEPKLLKVKCGFPEDCVSMCLLDPILSPLLLYLNSVVPTDLPCWCVSHQILCLDPSTSVRHAHTTFPANAEILSLVKSQQCHAMTEH